MAESQMLTQQPQDEVCKVELQHLKHPVAAVQCVEVVETAQMFSQKSQQEISKTEVSNDIVCETTVMKYSVDRECNGHTQHISGDGITRFSNDKNNYIGISRDPDVSSSSRYADGGNGSRNANDGSSSRYADGGDGSRNANNGSSSGNTNINDNSNYIGISRYPDGNSGPRAADGGRCPDGWTDGRAYGDGHSHSDESDVGCSSRWYGDGHSHDDDQSQQYTDDSVYYDYSSDESDEETEGMVERVVPEIYPVQRPVVRNYKQRLRPK